eukprot:440364_1
MSAKNRHASSINIELSGAINKRESRSKKKKKLNAKNKKHDETMNINQQFGTVDEAAIDDLYGEDFDVNHDTDIVIESNTKKIKAVQLLIDACLKGGREPPSVVMELNYDKYAVYCFTYVMGKLELKQRPFLFHTFEFLAMVSPTTVMIQLIIQYKKQFLMLPYKRIDAICLAVIRGSKYSIATSLKMAALAKEFSEIDLSAKEVFLKIKEKYVGIAVELLKQIESHHLAAVLLETPSDIEGMTPLELAFDNQLFSFLSQSKIEKIAHQVWIEQFYLNPTRTFEVSDIDSWNVLEFLKNPYMFYFQPYGKYMTATFLFVSYLLMFSYILIQRPGIYDVPQPIEIIFWVFNIGYLGFEAYQAFVEDGLKEYLTDWTNYIDMAISINFAAQIVMRLIWIFDVGAAQCDNDKENFVEYNYNSGLELEQYQRCPTTAQIRSISTGGYWSAACGVTFADWVLPVNDSSRLCSFVPDQAFYYNATYKCDCWKQLDHYLSNSCCRADSSSEAVMFNFLYGVNAILLWTRTLYFAEQDSTLGPLIKIIMAMKDDFINYLKLTMLFMIGFSFAIRAFIGDYSYEFDTVPSTILYMFKSTFGKIDFSVLEACGDMPNDLCKDHGWIPVWRSNLVQCLMMVYLILALLMIRLLIAMISFTYNKMIRQAEHQVVYQYIKNAYELDQSSGLMPPPLNIFVFAITVVWLIMDTLMVILINRYIDVENHLQLAKPVGSSYIKRVWHGIQDLFSRNTSYWICAHCKAHNFENFDIRNYLSQFRPACDPADAKIVEVYAPEMCRKCYRNKSTVGRMTIVLQQISFLVFCVAVYPVLCLVVLIPAMISWLRDFLTDSSADEGQWSNMEDEDDDKRKQLKRHQTMSGVTSIKKNKRSPEYKLKKQREKERKKKQEMIKQAERYRMMRQMQQLDTQLDAIPTTESHTTLNALRKSLKQIIKHYNPRRTKHILTPNINTIVDDVTSDKTPIAKLQVQVRGISENIDRLFDLMKASQQLTAATTLAQMQSIPESQLQLDPEHKSPQDDDFMQSVSKAAQQIQSALQLSPHASVRKPHRIRPHHEVRMSVKDIAATLLTLDDVPSGMAPMKRHASLIMKPTDVMKHKSSYKMKLVGVDDDDGVYDEDKEEEAAEPEPEPVISSNIKANGSADHISENTEKYLESLLHDAEDNIADADDDDP